MACADGHSQLVEWPREETEALNSVGKWEANAMQCFSRLR